MLIDWFLYYKGVSVGTRGKGRPVESLRKLDLKNIEFYK